MKQTGVCLALGLTGVLLALGAQPVPTVDSVKILSILPTTDAPLRAGEKVTFKVEVEYNLNSANSGTVTLVIQQAESGRPGLANEVEVVMKGRDRIVLEKEIQIPQTKAVQVFTPLNVQGGTSTRVVDHRIYKVIP